MIVPPPRRLARALAAAAVLTALYGCARKEWNADNAFVVLRVVPDVKTLSARELSWLPASANQLMRPNDKLQTFAGASAIVGLKNDQQLFVRELTLLVFGDYDKDDVKARTTGAVEVQSGAVQTRSLDAARRADMEFRTPNSSVKVGRRVDGGGYDLVIDSGKDDKLSVLLGTAAVSAQGETVSVPEDFGTMVKHGEKPMPPRLLPPAPALQPSSAADYFRADMFEGVALEWKASTGAASYRAVVAEDPSFAHPAQESGAAGTSVLARDLKGGLWYWRVSARDADGLEGKPSPAGTFRVADKAFPDLQRPADGVFLVRRREVGGRRYVGGWARRGDLGDAEIAVYALADAWYLQWYPYSAAKPHPVVDPDGYWELRVNGGTRYKAYLVRKGAKLPDFVRRDAPPKVDGRDILAEASER